MDAEAEVVANMVLELQRKKGLKDTFDVIMTGMMSVCDRQKLHAVVSQWKEDNSVLAMPPLGGGGGEVTGVSSENDSSDDAVTVVQHHKPKPNPKNTRKHPTPRCPPWLAHAGLPSDSTTPSSAEISAFAAFVGATNNEHSARASMRMSLQKLVQLLVSQEAILKVIGGWATGLATFSSTLDLVVEAQSVVNVLDKVAVALQDLGVKSEFKVVAGFSVLRLSSDALAHAVWGQQQVLTQTNRQIQQGFDVNIFSECAGSTGPLNSRSATMRVSSRLNKFPEHKKTAVVIRSIIDKTNIGEHQGGPNGYIILLMILAFLEEHRDDPSISDSGWVLRNFFKFYSNFNFKTTTIVPVPAPNHPVFIPKIDPQSQLSIVDPLATSSSGFAPYNVASGVTKLNQLTGTLQYINMLITRYDKDPRGTSLLPNLVACGEVLWKRHAWLRKGIEVTKSLAVQVAKGVADFLESPANTKAKEELIKIAAWEPMNNSLATKLQLITRVTEQPNSPLLHFRGHVPQLVEALSQYQDNPEVRAHYERSLRSSVTKDFAAAIVKEVADYITDPENIEFKQALQANSFQQTTEAMHQNKALHILEKVSEKPGSILAEFRPCMDSFVTVVREQDFNEPEIEKHHYRILAEMVTPEVASRVAAEAADFLEEMARSPKRDEIMKNVIGSGEWSQKQDFAASISILGMMREKSTSVLHGMNSNAIPVFAKVLAEFSDLPEVRENRRRAAAAAFSKDLAVAIQRDVLAFVNKPDNEKVRATLKSSWQSGDPAVFRKELLAALCNEPGSRLSDFRGEKGVEELNGLLAPYDEDPDLLAANQKIAESVFADLGLSEE